MTSNKNYAIIKEKGDFMCWLCERIYSREDLDKELIKKKQKIEHFGYFFMIYNEDTRDYELVHGHLGEYKGNKEFCFFDCLNPIKVCPICGRHLNLEK